MTDRNRLGGSPRKVILLSLFHSFIFPVVPKEEVQREETPIVPRTWENSGFILVKGGSVFPRPNLETRLILPKGLFVHSWVKVEDLVTSGGKLGTGHSSKVLVSLHDDKPPTQSRFPRN